MTIDEAQIMLKAKAKCIERICKGIYEDCNEQKCDNCDLCYAQGTNGEQIELMLQCAEWLEELKAYREIGTVEGYKNAIECYTKEYMIRKSNVQYDKAVDDFVHECDKHCEFYSGKNKNITREDILKIAEQLKERNNE